MCVCGFITAERLMQYLSYFHLKTSSIQKKWKVSEEKPAKEHSLEKFGADFNLLHHSLEGDNLKSLPVTIELKAWSFGVWMFKGNWTKVSSRTTLCYVAYFGKSPFECLLLYNYVSIWFSSVIKIFMPGLLICKWTISDSTTWPICGSTWTIWEGKWCQMCEIFG